MRREIYQAVRYLPAKQVRSARFIRNTGREMAKAKKTEKKANKSSAKTATGRVLHDPVRDKLRPIFPLDLSKCTTIDSLVRAMGDTAYTARQVGDGADVLEAMARDKDCFVVMTLAGALTVGKMGLIFCDLIESGVVNAIVSTGALMAHGLVERRGFPISATTLQKWTTKSFSTRATTAFTIRLSRKRIWITWKT